ncbi:AsmA family protein [Castellaniella sp.]|uniref:AsmA family protein n=1 Tax=Castellaniella sp. TaxID=1955812 RepID=UPI002B0011CF|nr:AsmA family protein [Castellaniella sp.]
MNVWLKRVLFSLVVALLVAVVGLAIFLLTFNPNAYKSRLEQLVFDRYARTLTIGGDISLSLFPRIGLSVSDVALSNHSSKDTFVSIDSARFAVAIWPLLSNQLVVDHVAITGLKAWVVRDTKGRFNFGDLLESGRPALASAAPAGSVVAAPLIAAAGAADDPEGRTDMNIDIAGLELKGGQIHYLDQRSGLSTTLSSIEANTGRVTYDQPFDVSLKAQVAGDDPVQDAQLQAQALLRLNPGGRGYYSAQKINVQLNGRLGNLDQANAALKGNLAYKGSERRLSAGNLELTLAGNIVGAHPIQALKASLTAGQLRLDPRNLELNVAKLALRASGQDRGRNLELALDAPALAVSPESAQADPIAATLKSSGDQTLAVSLGLEGLSGNANDWQFRKASLDGALTQGPRLVQVKLTSPLTWNTTLRKGGLTALKGDVTLRDQKQPKFLNEVPMIGSVHLDLVRDALDVDLNAVMDGGQAALKATTTRLVQPQTRFSLSAEKIDLNHWVPKPAPVPAKPPAADQGAAAPKAATPAPAAAPSVIDLSFLKGLDIQGDLKIADLRIRDLQLTQVATPVQVAEGALSLPKLTAKLYDGSLNAQARAAADQTLSLKLNLDKVAVAPLLQAALGRDLLSGQGAAQLDLKTQGNTVDAWMQGLSGRASWQVKDGAVHGIDATRTLTDVSAALGNVLKGRLDALASPFDKQRSTPFSTLEGRVDLKDGQGTVSKLLLASSLVRVTAGKPAQIDVPGQRLDLQLLAQVAARAPKPLSGTLGSLLGVTIPVQVTGDWAHPDYAVQWGSIHNQSIQQAVKSGLMELIKGKDLIEQALPSPESEPNRAGSDAATKSDPVERIGNALKGLLGQ